MTALGNNNLLNAQAYSLLKEGALDFAEVIIFSTK
ncbi:hypothetical protein N752_31185 [Desulforamulus aquiferis]|nr:hypothetical protein N752_31185 [Desulforamulus aquiferis]